MLNDEEVELGKEEDWKANSEHSRPPNPNATFKPAIDLNPNCGKWGKVSRGGIETKKEEKENLHLGEDVIARIHIVFVICALELLEESLDFGNFGFHGHQRQKKTTTRITAIQYARKAA